VGWGRKVAWEQAPAGRTKKELGESEVAEKRTGYPLSSHFLFASSSPTEPVHTLAGRGQ